MARHTFAGSGHAPSALQRGLDDYDRDTITYLADVGVSEEMLRRVVNSMPKVGERPILAPGRMG